MKNFAKLLTSLVLVLFMFTASAQLSLNVSGVKTSDKDIGVAIGIQYVARLDSILKSQEIFFVGNRSIFHISPEFRFRTGTQDAFSSIEAKMSGMFMKFHTKDYKGLIIPDLSKPVTTFPISIGAETDITFRSVNGIVEAGFVPWYQSETSDLPAIVRYTKFGIYLQGGYKFGGDSVSTAIVGGLKDESSEKINSSLLRAKASFSVDTKRLADLQGLKVGLVGNADVWYDFVNSRYYHKIDAIARFYLADNNSFDVIYSKGSGAPNFNQGDQYGLGLNIQF